MEEPNNAHRQRVLGASTHTDWQGGQFVLSRLFVDCNDLGTDSAVKIDNDWRSQIQSQSVLVSSHYSQYISLIYRAELQVFDLLRFQTNLILRNEPTRRNDRKRHICFLHTLKPAHGIVLPISQKNPVTTSLKPNQAFAKEQNVLRLNVNFPKPSCVDVHIYTETKN